MGSEYFVLVSEHPGEREKALDMDASVVGNRLEHPRGVRAFPTLEDAVDPHFGPPAFPFSVVVVTAPVAGKANPDDTVTARSWSVSRQMGAQAVFGEHGAVVVERLSALQQPMQFDSTVVARAVALLTVSLGRPRGRGLAGERPGWQATSAAGAADAIPGEARWAALAARSVVWSTITGAVPNTWAEGPAREAAADLVGSAVAWGAKGESGPNPYEPALALARMGVVAAPSQAALTLWREGRVISRTGLLSDRNIGQSQTGRLRSMGGSEALTA